MVDIIPGTTFSCSGLPLQAYQYESAAVHLKKRRKNSLQNKLHLQGPQNEDLVLSTSTKELHCPTGERLLFTTQFRAITVLITAGSFKNLYILTSL